MPKGKRGCYLCGERTTVMVQVWRRDYLQGESTSGGNRRERTAGSGQRAYCEACGEVVFAVARRAVAREWDAHHGCAVCGRRTAGRLQVWMRTFNPTRPRTSYGCLRQDSSKQASATLCADHAEPAWALALEALEGLHATVDGPA